MDDIIAMDTNLIHNMNGCDVSTSESSTPGRKAIIKASWAPPLPWPNFMRLSNYEPLFPPIISFAPTY